MLTKLTVQCDDLLDLQETENSLIERLDFYLQKHPEKSIVIDKILETNTLIVKTFDLGVSVN